MKNYNQVLPRYIYHLVDPSTQEVFYVGQTIDPGARLKKHAEKVAFIPVMKTVALVHGTYPEASAVEQAEMKKFPADQLQNRWRVRE